MRIVCSLIFFFSLIIGALSQDEPCIGTKPVFENGKTIFCGDGSNTRDCPSGSYCDIARDDAYATCCKNKPCIGTKPVLENGNTIFCGRGPGRRDCPSGSYCDVAPNDAYATCCKNRI